MVPRVPALRAFEIVRKDAWVPEELAARLRIARRTPRGTRAPRRPPGAWTPRSGLGRAVRECLRYLPPELAAELVDRLSSCVVAESSLSIAVLRRFGTRRVLAVEDYGVVSRKVVTTAGVNYIVDALQNLVEPENLKFHALGTGTNVEAVGDTALQAELTTQYSPDNTRATGSLAEGASGNIFRSVGTNAVDAAAGVTEHGLMSQAATGGGTLFDRSVFSVVNLASGDSLAATYEWSLSPGG